MHLGQPMYLWLKQNELSSGSVYSKHKDFC